jgi:hypothetical protein
VLKEENYQHIISDLTKISFRDEGEIKTLSDDSKGGFSTSVSARKELLMEDS